MSSRAFLTILGVVLIVVGVFGLFWHVYNEPIWYSIVEIVVGLIAVYVASTEKAK